jgi:hypothetical protein
VIAIALAAFGVYAASLVLPMLGGSSSLVLLIGFLLQAVLGLAAAFGVWRGAGWAPGAIVLLGVSVAGTWLCEAFILGIVAYLYALLAAALALIIAILLAMTVSRQGAVAAK